MRYFKAIVDVGSRKRCTNELKLVDGLDPDEIPRSKWQSDVNLWPAITHIPICMYLLLTPSPYSERYAYLKNYTEESGYIEWMRYNNRFLKENVQKAKQFL